MKGQFFSKTLQIIKEPISNGLSVWEGKKGDHHNAGAHNYLPQIKKVLLQYDHQRRNESTGSSRECTAQWWILIKSCSATIQCLLLILTSRVSTLGDLTLNFPTFSKPVLNLDFYIKTDQGSTQVSNIQENNVESCTNFRFCHQAPIFQLRLFLGPIFGQKNIFCKTNFEDGQKVR